MDGTGKIMPVARCGYVANLPEEPEHLRSRLEGNNYYYKPTTKRVAEFALAQLEEARAKDVATHEANLPAINNNEAVRARVEALMADIGMPTSWKQQDFKSRSVYRKLRTVEPGWKDDVAREIPVADGFETKTYERRKVKYLEFAQKAELEEVNAAQVRQRAEADRKAARRADLELAAIILRHNLELDADWSDALNSLREKNQRLDLAIAMMDVRGDWNDGPGLVSNALGRFTAQTDEDKAIELSIRGLCEDWCGDGRIFRDCTWSYDRLVASVTDQQLVRDALIARQRRGDQ